jgi:hypothetical protein
VRLVSGAREKQRYEKERTAGHGEDVERMSSGSEIGTRKDITKDTTLKYLARWPIEGDCSMGSMGPCRR